MMCRMFLLSVATAFVTSCGNTDFISFVPDFMTPDQEQPLPDAMQRGIAPRQVIVSSKSFKVEGPTGYCPDVASIKDADSNAFVALAMCSRMKAGDVDAQVPALLTVSVQGPSDQNVVTGAENAFIAFLDTNAGKSVIARSGNASDVVLSDVQRDGRAVYAWVDDTSAGIPAGVRSAAWRGFFDLNGRLVSLAAYQLTSEPYDKEAGLKLLQSFEMKLRAENPQSSTKSGT